MWRCFWFFFSSRRRHTRLTCDWSSDVCSSDLQAYDRNSEVSRLRPPEGGIPIHDRAPRRREDRKSTRLNSSHMSISYAVFCLKKKKKLPPSSYRLKNKQLSTAA